MALTLCQLGMPSATITEIATDSDLNKLELFFTAETPKVMWSCHCHCCSKMLLGVLSFGSLSNLLSHGLRMATTILYHAIFKVGKEAKHQNTSFLSPLAKKEYVGF